MDFRTIGSAFLIAGTTIGAGMLAMPITSAGIGAGFTLLLLVALWALLTYSALLFVEVYQAAPDAPGIATLAEQFFGKGGRWAATLSLWILLYALSAAYITGGGSLLNGVMPAWLVGDDATGSLTRSIIIFTVILGLTVIIGMRAVDMTNRVIFLLQLAVLAVVLAWVMPYVAPENLRATPVHYALIISAAPIFFTSFGFHVVIPSIERYLNGDIKKIKTAIFIGTLLPLMIYILWQIATHGLIDQTSFLALASHTDTPLDHLVASIREGTQSPLLGEAFRLFSALAIITSFLGVSLSLFDGIDDVFIPVTVPLRRWVIGLVTFIPPLVFALYYPRGFLLALSYAGMIFAFYGLIMPVALAFRARRRHPYLPYRVIGGNVGLVITLLLGIIIMLIPFLVQANWLPKVAG